MMMCRCIAALVLALVALDTARCFVVPGACTRYAWGTRNSVQFVLLASNKGRPAGKKNSNSPVKKASGFGSGASAQPSTRSNSKTPSGGGAARLRDLVLSGAATPEVVAARLRVSPGDLDTIDSEGYTLLHLACRAGLADVVKVLIEAGADAEAVGGGGGARPLHLAALGDHSKVVEVLLANGAQVDRVDQGPIGGSPLIFAANAGAHHVIDALLSAGASVSATSRDGRNLLQVYAQCLQILCVF